MNIDELVKEQRAKEETYDNERTDVRNRIAHLEQRLKDMKFPHWSDMLSQIMKEVNKITEPRGIVFKTSNYRTLGLDPGILVFQDYMHSKKQMYGNLKFEFYEALFYTYDRRRIAIHSVDDIIKIIDGFEKKHEEELDETLQKYGSWERQKRLCSTNSYIMVWFRIANRPRTILLNASVVVLIYVPFRQV